MLAATVNILKVPDEFMMDALNKIIKLSKKS